MAEYKFKDSFEFVPYARLVFSANHPPKSQDASPAFFRRWLVVPFERTFADGAPSTIPGDKLDAMLSDPEELSGVLNKALEAMAAIRTRGLSESESSSHATDEFRQATDPLAVWLDRKTILHADAVTPQDRLYREYSHVRRRGTADYQQDRIREVHEEASAHGHRLSADHKWHIGLVLRRHFDDNRGG